jgi:hypothetical protein
MRGNRKHCSGYAQSNSSGADEPRANSRRAALFDRSQTKSAIASQLAYGAYVPKEVTLQSLSNHQRFQLFLRQSFTTPGVYLKTAFFSLSDQVANSPLEWGDGFGGYAKRTASRYGQFVTQNALAGLGNGLLGYEPRYNRCRCTGFWPRTRHALIRNFVTYDRTEQHLRPQLGMYAGAFGAGVIAGPGCPTIRA